MKQRKDSWMEKKRGFSLTQQPLTQIDPHADILKGWNWCSLINTHRLLHSWLQFMSLSLHGWQCPHERWSRGLLKVTIMNHHSRVWTHNLLLYNINIQPICYSTSNSRYGWGTDTHKHRAGCWVGFNLAVRQCATGQVEMSSVSARQAVSSSAAQITVGTQCLTWAVTYLHIKRSEVSNITSKYKRCNDITCYSAKKQTVCNKSL